MRYLLAAWQAAMLVALWGSANPGYATLTKKAPTAAQHWVVTERGSLEFYSADVDNWKAYTCCRYDLVPQFQHLWQPATQPARTEHTPVECPAVLPGANKTPFVPCQGETPEQYFERFMRWQDSGLQRRHCFVPNSKGANPCYAEEAAEGFTFEVYFPGPVLDRTAKDPIAVRSCSDPEWYTRWLAEKRARYLQTGKQIVTQAAQANYSVLQNAVGISTSKPYECLSHTARNLYEQWSVAVVAQTRQVPFASPCWPVNAPDHQIGVQDFWTEVPNRRTEIAPRASKKVLLGVAQGLDRAGKTLQAWAAILSASAEEDFSAEDVRQAQRECASVN